MKRSLKRPRPTLAAALHGSKALLLLSNTLSGCQRIADQHELALDASLTEQFLGATSLGQWHPHGHHRLDFAVAKQLQQGAEIFAEPGGPPPLQILYAVGEYASSAW